MIKDEECLVTPIVAVNHPALSFPSPAVPTSSHVALTALRSLSSEPLLLVWNDAGIDGALLHGGGHAEI